MGYIMRNGVPYGAGITPIEIVGVLQAGSTTISFTNDAIIEGGRFNVYAWNNPSVKPIGASVSNHTLTLTYSAQSTDIQIKLVINENVNTTLSDNIGTEIVTFTEAQARANIVSGESLTVIFGKIQKWLDSNNSLWLRSDTLATNTTTCSITDDSINSDSVIETFFDSSSGVVIPTPTYTISNHTVTFTFIKKLPTTGTLLVRVSNV